MSKGIDINEIKLGRVYHVIHFRKGEFDVRITEVSPDGEWARGMVMDVNVELGRITWNVSASIINELKKVP